jgi:hypothetical protein
MQNALVPTYHCMHTPGGPLKYSLEGHQVEKARSFLCHGAYYFIL